MTEAKPKDYWISPSALKITLNALSDADYIQATAASGAMVLCYMKGIEGLGYDNGHNYKRWPLKISQTYFTSTSKKYIYIRIPREGNNDTDTAMVVFPSEHLDLYGMTEGGQQVGDDGYYYIFTQGIISASEPSDEGLRRHWEQNLNTGTLDSDEALDSGGTGEWWEYNPITDMVTFLKKIAHGEFEELLADYLEAEQTVTDLVVSRNFLSGPDGAGFRLIRNAGNDVSELEVDRATIREKMYANWLQSSDYTGEGMLDTGFRLWYENGRSKLVIDDLVARGKFSVYNLETRIMTHAGGDVCFSGAGSKLFYVEYLNDAGESLGYTTINSPWMLRDKFLLAGASGLAAWANRRKIQRQLTQAEKASVTKFRCYVFSDDGTMKTRNWWHVHDLARCQTFDHTQLKQTSEGYYSGDNVSNTVYWRRVAGIGSKRIEALGDNKIYDYFDLWNVADVSNRTFIDEQGQEQTIGFDIPAEQYTTPGYLQTSQEFPYGDWPAAGDDVVQFGNARDVDRQAVNVLQVTGGEPGLKVYHGIHDYRTDNTKWVSIGYDARPTMQRANAEIFGDCYIGERYTNDPSDGGSYVWFTTKDTATGQPRLRIKARISAQSTYGDSGNVTLEDVFDGKAAVYDTWNAWVVDNVSQLHLRDLLVPAADITQGGITYKRGKVYRCTSLNPLTFSEIAYTDDAAFNGYISQILSGSGASGDAATVANAARALNNALKGQTDIIGGLMLTTMIAMRKLNAGGSYTTWGGLNGAYTDGNTIAAWFGGDFVDYDALTDAQKAEGWSRYRWATSLFRMNGSGYVAGGNIRWNDQGEVVIQGHTLKTANFYLNGTDVTQILGDLLSMFELDKTTVPGTTFIKAKFSLYSVGDVSAQGASSGGGGGGGGGASTLDELNDVTILANLQDGQALVYDGENRHWSNKTIAQALANLTDVDLTGLANGDSLVYDGNARQWKPGTGGVDMTAVWTALAAVDAMKQINYSHLSGAVYIDNGTIHIGSASITPITSHQSLANYFTHRGQAAESYFTGTYSTLENGTYFRQLSGSSSSLIHFQCSGSASGLDLYFLYPQDANNPIYYRKCIDSNRFASSFAYLIDSLNIGSQSVNYATSAGMAGSAGSADTVPWTGISGMVQGGNEVNFCNEAPSGNRLWFNWRGRNNTRFTISDYFFGNGNEGYTGTTVYAGNYYAAGDVTAASDKRKKDFVEDAILTAEQIAEAPAVKFKWKDKRDEDVHVGTYAQYWQKVLPESVSEVEDTLGLNYGAAATVAVVNLAREVVDMKAKMKEQQKTITEQGKMLEEQRKMLEEQRKMLLEMKKEIELLKKGGMA